MFGISTISIRQNLLPLLADTSVDSSGRGKKYFAPDVLRAWLKREIGRPNRPKDADDPLLTGINSPAQERYRAAKADLAEMERDRIRGVLVARSDVHEACGRFAGKVRNAAGLMCESCRIALTRALQTEGYGECGGDGTGGDSLPAGDSDQSASDSPLG